MFLQSQAELALGSRFKALSEHCYRIANAAYRALGIELDAHWFPVLRYVQVKGPDTVTQIANEIGQTWLAVAGPGVRVRGIDHETWSDHADIVPTMMHLAGLSTDYQPDGRVITQALTRPVAKRGNGESFTELGDLYKQLNAPYGAFNHWLIVASTRGIKSDDATYLKTERAIQQLAAQRDALVTQMKGVLNGGDDGHAEQLIRTGLRLLEAAQDLAGS